MMLKIVSCYALPFIFNISKYPLTCFTKLSVLDD